jgi:hypothetical protein
VALKKGVAPPNAERYAPHEMAINLVGGGVDVGVVCALASRRSPPLKTGLLAGVTLWMKLSLLALSRQAHGLGLDARRG